MLARRHRSSQPPPFRKTRVHVAAYLRSHLALPDSLVQERSLGIDWQGLIELVEVSDMRHRDEVLALLRNTPEWIVRNGQVVDGRMRRLGMLHGGRPYWYMYEHLFPELRNSGGLCRQRNRTASPKQIRYLPPFSLRHPSKCRSKMPRQQVF